MAEGICTEREWRKRGGSVHIVPAVCWGAVCLRPVSRRTIHTSRFLHVCMLAGAMAVAAVIILLGRFSQTPTIFPMAAVPAAACQPVVRQVPGLSFSVPTDLPMVPCTYTAQELYGGKLLLLDALHPLPSEAPAPATINIATYGKGMVPVRELALRSGKETVLALRELFAQLRENGVTAFVVWRATETTAVTAGMQYTAMRELAGNNSLETAAKAAQATCGIVGREALRQAYTVELRMLQPGSQLPDERPLEQTAEGRQLLRLAWRNGFVRVGDEGAAAFCFRYVGKAHATAITYLDVDLHEYLAVLHAKQTLTIRAAEAVYYIQCKPVEGAYLAFSVPSAAVCEASMDNTGYAVVACTVPST